MANEEQLSILKQGVQVWNNWREENLYVKIDLKATDLRNTNLKGANLMNANLREARLGKANLSGSNLMRANLMAAGLGGTDLSEANLKEANLSEANLVSTNLQRAVLIGANLSGATLTNVNLQGAHFQDSKWVDVMVNYAIFGFSNLSQAVGLQSVVHFGPSSISTDTFAFSKGKIPRQFLQGCGLSDWEVEEVKLYNPDLSNDDVSKILYKIYDLRATQALQIAPLFISYSHGDSAFVDKVGISLKDKGIRFWRDIHEMKAGRIEKQIDQAINQNRTVLLVLSEHSLGSDWVEHEVRTARELEKEMRRDVLCPVALDDSWKSSHWPKRLMEQIMEYNILDFSDWHDDSKFDGMFRKLIDGLELFYKR